MSEYIRRSDALAQAAFVHGRWDDTYVSSEKLKAIPVVDAVVVTRCKDCRYRVNETPNANGVLICNANDMAVAPDDFCSYGEPKEVR